MFVVGCYLEILPADNVTPLAGIRPATPSFAYYYWLECGSRERDLEPTFRASGFKATEV